MSNPIKLLFIFSGAIAAAISLVLFWAMLALGADSELLKFDGELKWKDDSPPEIHFESDSGKTSQFVFPRRCMRDGAKPDTIWTCFREFLDDLIATHPKAKEIMDKHQIQYKKG